MSEPTDQQIRKKEKKNTSFPKYVFFTSFIHILFSFFGEVIHFVSIENRQLPVIIKQINSKRQKRIEQHELKLFAIAIVRP